MQIDARFGLYWPVMFLLCHFVGDYFLQSDWMALHKSKGTLRCLVHVLFYACPFLLLTTSWKVLLFIAVTHFVFDHWPVVVRRMIWVKNHFPTLDYPSFEFCDSTGYYDDSPYNTQSANNGTKVLWGQPRHFFVTVWLYIITDNTLHLACNLAAFLLFTE